VSRTFALTIPELPADLEQVVGNAYLLCRLADTIEDEPTLAPEERREMHALFADAVEGSEDPARLAVQLGPRLSEATLPAERELVRRVARVVRITRGFEERPRRALARCVGVMSRGMGDFAERGLGNGLASVGELHEYCYYVAGVVGEMLTELFCHHSPEIDRQRDELTRRAVSFGHGLQLTNILKDVWDDRARGYCWLPRDLFQRHGFDLGDLAGLGERSGPPGLHAGLRELIGIARTHLTNALDYTLLLPRGEVGIRRFCLWALGMAVLTLRKIDRHVDYRRSVEVKIRRRSVRATVLATRALTRNDALLRALFRVSCVGLPRPEAARAWRI